jgi:HSP20 family protein
MVTFTLFDDIEKQMVDMLRASEHPGFGRVEPVENGINLRKISNCRQHPFMRARIDLFESPGAYKVILELPGVKKEDIKVSVDEGNVLNIEAELPETLNKELDKVHYRELRYGTFSRSVNLPHGASTDNVKARLNNGLLELEFPKTQKEASKLITIS